MNEMLLDMHFSAKNLPDPKLGLCLLQRMLKAQAIHTFMMNNKQTEMNEFVPEF